MDFGHLSRELANLGFAVLVLAAGFLFIQLVKHFFPRNDDDDDTYVIVDKTGRKFTVTLKFECSLENQRENEEQLKRALHLEH